MEIMNFSSIKKPKISYFDNIPDEIIVKIFSDLNWQDLGRCASVCRRFLRLAYDGTLWRRVNMFAKTVPADTIGQLLARGTRYLSLGYAKLLSPIKMRSRAGSFQLKYLDLSHCKVNVRDLEKIISNCHTLEKLSLEAVAINNKICLKIVQSAQSLAVLNLAWTRHTNTLCGNGNLEGIMTIITKCQELVELNLKTWPQNMSVQT